MKPVFPTGTVYSFSQVAYFYDLQAIEQNSNASFRWFFLNVFYSPEKVKAIQCLKKKKNWENQHMQF